MKTLLSKKIIAVVLAVLWLVACSSKDANSNSKAHIATEAHAREKSELHDEANHEGPEHEEGKDEKSDLDRPISELFAATCEHKLKTHECDECRYEVGVVKADESLFRDGLLEKTKVQKRTISFPLKLTGEVRFDQRRVAHVSTQAEGIVKRAHVTVGDRVKRGQALVEIESVSVGEAQAAYLESRGMVELAERNHARLNALRKEGISSEKELLIAKQVLDAAQIRADAAVGKLTRLGMSSSAVRALTQKNSKGRLILRSPSDGTVLDMHAVAGEVARADTSLATIGDNSSLWVWADLYERDIALVSRSQASGQLVAIVEVKAFPGEEFTGTVDFVSPSMNESTRTVKARIAMPNPGRRLLAGMFARVKIFIPGDQEALTVPCKAVLLDEGRTFVFVHHKGDYYVRRPVAAGRCFAGLRQITQGLIGDEVIVSNGAFLMKSDVLRSKMGAGCAD